MSIPGRSLTPPHGQSTVTSPSNTSNSSYLQGLNSRLMTSRSTTNQYPQRGVGMVDIYDTGGMQGIPPGNSFGFRGQNYAISNSSGPPSTSSDATSGSSAGRDGGTSDMEGRHFPPGLGSTGSSFNGHSGPRDSPHITKMTNMTGPVTKNNSTNVLIGSGMKQVLQKKPIQTSKDSRVTNIPMMTDQFNSMGVLGNAQIQALRARQAKTQSPVIMQSVKSTHVQKPILQTAIAPVAPVATPSNTSRPPPTYDTACSRASTASNVTTSSKGGYSESLDSSPPRPPPPYTATLATVTHDDAMSISSGNSDQRNNHQVHPIPPPLPPANATTRPPLPTPFTDPPPYDVSVLLNKLNRLRAAMNVPTSSPPPPAVPVKASVSQVPARPPPPLPPNSDLVNTVESLCASQVNGCNGPILPPKPSSVLDHRRNSHQFDTASISESEWSSITSTSNMSLTSSNMTSNNSIPIHTSSMVPPPPPPISTIPPRRPAPLPPGWSDESSSVHSVESSRGSSVIGKRITHHSPIPERRQLSKEKEQERRETKFRNYSPAAFKFYMEQHIENVIKSHQEREMRRKRLEKEMSKLGLSEADQAEMRKLLQCKESNYIRLRRAKMDKSLFQVIRVIGNGAFGEVSLVKKVDADKLYAMKTLRKKDVLKRNQVAHVKAERDILAEADNEWVVKLYYSFQDADNLYFIMDYIPGGDLMFLLQKLEIFDENLAKFYVAELVLALESVHRMGFIHRDIKPDNILIDKKGHIKLTDFGLCTGFRWTHNSKYYTRGNHGDHSRQDSIEVLEDDFCCLSEPSNVSRNGVSAVISSITNGISKPLDRRRKRCLHQRCQAHSLVGTPNYIAPEVLMRIPYTQSCDWWSMGVILYEMVIGAPPFYAPSPEETQQKVINWTTTLNFPKKPDISPAARDVIVRLLSGQEDRLGRSGADEIKNHPFFEGIDFCGLRQKEAPYVPKISDTDPTDTSNFDILPSRANGSSTSPGRAPLEGYVNGDRVDSSGRHPDHAFLEFTFRRFFDDAGNSYSMRTTVDVISATSGLNPTMATNGKDLVGSTAAASAPTTSGAGDKGQGSPVYV